MSLLTPKPFDFFLPCEAGCHSLRVQVDADDPLVYLSFYVGAFYSGQESFFRRLRRRLGIAITALRGREYEFEDIVLSSHSGRQLGLWLLEAANNHD